MHEEVAQELIVLKYELERQMLLCIDGDTNLITCMQSLRRVNDENEGLKKSLKELRAVAEPVADLFEPRQQGVEPRPLEDRLRDTTGRLLAFVQRLARSVPQQVLAMLKSFFPKAQLEAVGQGVAADCSDEKF